jgi:hypothetical protein
MELVLVERLARHGPERVEPDVKRHRHRIERGEELRREVEAGRRCSGRARGVGVHGLVAARIGERLADVRRQRRLAGRLALEPEKPAAVAEMLDELDGSQPLTRPEPARRASETVPQPVGGDLFEEENLDATSARAPEAQTRRNDPRVVHDDELAREQVWKLREDVVLELAGPAAVDEQARGVTVREGTLRDELGRKLVVEDSRVHPALRVASPPMDELALERARQRIAEATGGRPEPALLEATLERSRVQVEALAAAAADLESSIPAQVAAAVRDGLRTEVLPVARHIAELRGLLNQAIRRLERLEGELLAERHARVDDLALLVDLVSSGWRGIDARLDRLERSQPHAADANGSARHAAAA